MIYADNAATTKLDDDAYKAMLPFLRDEYGNASQPYSFSRSAKKALKDSREIIAKSINAKPEEIYFTSGGTESDNWAIKGNSSIKDHGEIITSEFEHHAIIHSCESLKFLNVPVTYLRPSKDGFVITEDLDKAISNKTSLVSIMMVNNEIGTVQPIKDLCNIAHNYKILFHTDAVQAVGHIPVDVKDVGVDMLSASAHKFNGPKGVGFLYVKEGTSLLPFIDGGAQEFGMRAGTENVASIVGMAVALENNVKNMGAFQKKLRYLEKVVIHRLYEEGIDFIRNGTEPRNPGNLSLSFAGQDGERLLHRLDLMGIMVSTGSACNSQDTEISHVLKSIDLEENYARGTIRISFGHNNTEDDANRIAEALIKILKGH